MKCWGKTAKRARPTSPRGYIDWSRKKRRASRPSRRREVVREQAEPGRKVGLKAKSRACGAFLSHLEAECGAS